MQANTRRRTHREPGSQGQRISLPFGFTTWPACAAAAGLASSTRAAAMSAGRPMRPAGMTEA